MLQNKIGTSIASENKENKAEKRVGKRTGPHELNII